MFNDLITTDYIVWLREKKLNFIFGYELHSIVAVKSEHCEQSIIKKFYKEF